MAEDPLPRERPDTSHIDVFDHALRRLTPKVYVTYALVALNVGVFALMVGTGVSIMEPTPDVMIAWGGSYGPKLASGQWWRLLSANYLHYGIFHILLNMYVLFRSGPLVERLLGNAGFAVAYVMAGLAGSVASAAWRPIAVSAGASGAVFGVFGALLAVVLTQRASIPMAHIAQLRSSALTFVVVNIGFGLSMPMIDNAGHIGGLVGGFLVGLPLSRPIVGEPRRGRYLRSALVALGSAAVLGALTFFLVPRDTVDPFAEVDAFTSEANGLLERIKNGYDKVERNETSFEAYLDEYERDILPSWRATRERLDKVKGLPESGMKYVRLLQRYSEKREEGMRTWAEGARKNDEAIVKRGFELQREADAMMQQEQAGTSR